MAGSVEMPKIHVNCHLSITALTGPTTEVWRVNNQMNCFSLVNFVFRFDTDVAQALLR
jgi:hypothetical protein